MKKRFKLYLETSFWRRLVDAASDPRRIESYRFLGLVKKRHEILISRLVLAELETAPNATLRTALKRRINRVHPGMLFIPREAERIADELLSIQRRGRSDRADMLHLACARLNNVDALASWDKVDHACGSTRKAVARIARARGLANTYVGTPKEIAAWLLTR